MSVIFVESWSNKFFVSIKHISSMNECRTNRFTIYYGDNPRFWEEFVLWWCQKSVRQSVPDSCAHLSPFFAEILLFEKKKDWNCLKKTENERKCYAWIFTPKIAKKVFAFVGNFAWNWIFMQKMVKFFSLLFCYFLAQKSKIFLE